MRQEERVIGEQARLTSSLSFLVPVLHRLTTS